jgi:hypothetical protein
MTDRPLIVTDCDEVLLHFAIPFRAYLGEVHEMELAFTSFSLAGSIRRRACGSALDQAEFEPLLDGFFETHMPTQTPVPGAVEALAELSRDCDIVVLTNIVDAVALRRSHELERLGMPYPVRGNRGPKGRPVAALAEGRIGPVVFIDDLPPHHASVAKHAPHVHRLHMIADPELQALIPAAPDAHVRIDDWHAAHSHIRALLGG